MEAIAKYDFKATADDELSFKRGDILKVSADVVASRAWLPFLTLVTHKDAVLSLSSVHTLTSPGLIGQLAVVDAERLLNVA